MAAVQPPHSPSSFARLPSPPPIAEDQTTPQSPTLASFQDHDAGGSDIIDQGASRRIRPGTKAAEMHEGPPLVEFSDVIFKSRNCSACQCPS